MSWQDRAACQDVGGDWFAYVDSPAAKAALQICATCPVPGECLSFALTCEGHKQYRFGIFGGRTPAERKACALTRRRL